MSSPTLIIAPSASPQATPPTEYATSFTNDEVSFLESVLKFYQMTNPDWNIRLTEANMFTTVLGKIQGLQLNPNDVILHQIVSAAVATSSIAPNTIESITVTWSTPFSDNNYVVTCSIADDSGFLRFIGFSYLDGGVGISARVQNTSPDTNYQGTLNAMGLVQAS